MADVTRYPLARHLRGAPTMHVRHLRRGKVVHEGTGLSFFFRPLSAVLSEVPVGDRELPVLFHARTADFQDLTVQASVTFRVTDPVARRGANARREAEEAAAADGIKATAQASRELQLARARATAAQAMGEAKAAGEVAHVAAYRDLPAGSLLAMSVQELAGRLPQIGTLVLSPDLLAPVLARLAGGTGPDSPAAAADGSADAGARPGGARP
jgi:hypothetical protein